MAAKLVCGDVSNVLGKDGSLPAWAYCFAAGSGCPKHPKDVPYCFNRACFKDSKAKNRVERFA